MRQRQDVRRCLTPAAEDRHVGMAEAVDRLELVADEEHLLRGPGTDEVDELRLETIRVLELVDHDRSETKLLCLPDLLVLTKELPGAQLEILEVESGLPVLCGGVGRRKPREDLLQELTVTRGELLERESVHRRSRLVEGCGSRTTRRRRAEGEQPLRGVGRLEEVESLPRARGLQVGHLRVGGERRGLCGELVDRILEALLEPGLEHEVEGSRTERVVDAHEHRPQPASAVRGEKLPAIGLVGGAELVERDGERLTLDHARLRLVEDAEARVDPGGEWIGGEQAPTETMDRRDPGAVEIAGEIGAIELEQTCPDPGTELAGGAIGVGDHEQRVDVEAVVDDRAGKSLDEHGRLPRSRTGRDEGLAAGIDCGLLLRIGCRERPRDGTHGRSLRHIRQRVHQVGHSPPRGSWRTSPPRIRSARATAVSRA